MRCLYTLLLVLSVGFCNAQTATQFVNTAWSDSSFGAISEQLGGVLGIDYHAVNEKVSINGDKAIIHFSRNDAAKLITIELGKGTLSGNTQVVRQVQMSGPFADLYPAYQKLFNNPQTPEEVKQKGSIHTEPVMVSGKKYTAALRRDGNRSSENWILVIKD